MPAKPGFRAVQQTADILPVRPDDECRNEKRQRKYRPVPRTEDQRCDRKADSAGYGAERNIPRREPQQQKQPPADRRNTPVE